MKVAALDFGSNTFLLLICEIEKGRVSQVLVDEIEVVRLAQGMDEKKRFHPDALQRSCECLARFSKLIEQHRPEKILAVATSAARDAGNKQEFIDLVGEFAIPLEIITGSREAELTYKGSIFDQDPKGNFAIIDVGGGSTEIIGKSQAGQVRGWSVDVGSVRLTERMLPRHPLLPEDLSRLREFVSGEFEKVKDKIPHSGTPLEVIAVAGTPVALAQIEQKIDFIEERLHGYELKLEQISYWVDKLAGMSIEQRKQVPGMPAKRADIKVAGCAILEAALKALKKDRLFVSTKGVRYGVALMLAEEATQ